MNQLSERNREKLLGYRVSGAKMERFYEMALMFPREKKKFEKQAEKCRESMADIEKKISEVDDGILSEILFQKYVLGKSLEAVSEAVNYSKRQIERLHLIALEKIRV